MKHLLGMVGGLLAKKTHTHHLQQGEAALACGNWIEAEKHFARALELAEECKSYDAVAVSARRLGLICQQQDKLAVAETHLRKAYQTHEESDQHEAAAECLILLGKLYHKQRRFPDAEQVLQYAMSIHQSHFGNRSAGIAKAASCLAESLLLRDSFEEAEKLLRRAVDIEQSLPDQRQQLAIDTYRLATALSGRSQDTQAAAAFEQAGQLFDELSTACDSEFAHKACECWHHFGQFLIARGKNDQAKIALEKAAHLADAFPGYLDEASLAELRKIASS